jgi:hypothetical protein
MMMMVRENFIAVSCCESLMAFVASLFMCYVRSMANDVNYETVHLKDSEK